MRTFKNKMKIQLESIFLAYKPKLNEQLKQCERNLYSHNEVKL